MTPHINRNSYIYKGGKKVKIKVTEKGRTALIIIKESSLYDETIGACVKQFRHSGYEFDEEGLRKMLTDYSKSGDVLEAGMSYPLLRVLCGVKITTEDCHRHAILVGNAKKIFGTTNSFRKAAFILRDGTLLDFSSGSDRRIEDHRAIARAYEGVAEFGTMTEYLIDFMNQGNIRLMPECGLDICTRPTSKQCAAIRRFAAYKREFYVELSNERGNRVSFEEFDSLPSFDVAKKVCDYFDSLPCCPKGVPTL